MNGNSPHAQRDRAISRAAHAIIAATPDLGWDGLDNIFRRDALRLELTDQVSDALVFLAGWHGKTGSARTLAAQATGLIGRNVSPGALIIAAQIAGIHLNPCFPPNDLLIRQPLASQSPPDRAYLRMG